tara:strand:+ start:475 stop:855 length:381 start_codon:yes stop_codon:yes gene_type:complete
MTKKEYKFSKLISKFVGIILIAGCLYLAYVSVNKYRNYLGIFLSINCIVLANVFIRHFLPPSPSPSDTTTITSDDNDATTPIPGEEKSSLFSEGRNLAKDYLSSLRDKLKKKETTTTKAPKKKKKK